MIVPSLLWVCVIAFFAAGLVTAVRSGVTHFTFDYVWPARTAALG